uniref:Serine/threonine-protein kinase greatwall n=1 Tax=Panagrolaimus superbus TaxID=310955 RepID=A0A914YSC6_9BILA
MTPNISDAEKIKISVGALQELNVDRYLKLMKSQLFQDKLEQTPEGFWKPRNIWPLDLAQGISAPFLSIIAPGRTLGSGSFGSVSLCTFKGMGQKCVMKSFKRLLVPELVYEMAALKTCCDCEFIVKLLFAGFDTLERYCFILEYVGGGALWDHGCNGTPISLGAAKFICFQFVQAIYFLHKMKITHGNGSYFPQKFDIKPDNIGLTSKGHIRVFDFGKSRDITEARRLPGGTLIYNSPEIIQELKHQRSSDWWAFACTMAEVIQGETVFDDASGERSIIYNKIMNDAPVIKIQDNDLQEFFSHLLQTHPSARLKQVLQY